MKKLPKATRLVRGTADVKSVFPPLRRGASPRESVRAGAVDFTVRRGRRARAAA